MATAQCQQELQNNFPHACPLRTRTRALNLGDEAAVITMHRLHFLTAAANISIFHLASHKRWGFRINFITQPFKAQHKHWICCAKGLFDPYRRSQARRYPPPCSLTLWLQLQDGFWWMSTINWRTGISGEGNEFTSDAPLGCGWSQKLNFALKHVALAIHFICVPPTALIKSDAAVNCSHLVGNVSPEESGKHCRLIMSRRVEAIDEWAGSDSGCNSRPPVEWLSPLTRLLDLHTKSALNILSLRCFTNSVYRAAYLYFMVTCFTTTALSDIWPS